MAHKIMALECKVYVGNLGMQASKIKLERVFNYYGSLKNVWVARNPPGFAFVEFDDVRDAEDAAYALDGTVISGMRVRVEMSSGMSKGGNDRYGGGSGGRSVGGRHEDRDEGRSRRYERLPYSRSTSRSRSPYGGKERERGRSPRSRSRSRSRSPYGAKENERSSRPKSRSRRRSRTPYGGKERERSRYSRRDRSNSGSPAGRKGRSHHSRSSRRNRY